MKMERIVAYRIGERTFTDKAEAKLYECGQRLVDLMDASPTAPVMAFEHVAEWMMREAAAINKITGTYLRYRASANAAVNTSEPDPKPESEEGDE